MRFRKLLIDGDVIAYRAACAADNKDAGPEVSIPEQMKDAEQYADQIIEHVIYKFVPFPSPKDYGVFLTGVTNFRYEIAKAQPYKAHRPKEKPKYLGHVRNHLRDKWSATTSTDQEADDDIAIEAAKNNYEAIIVSVDKDFLQVPCGNYNFVKDEFREIDEWEGLNFFYSQILTGDAADHIPGLYRVGPVKAEKILKGAETEYDLYKKCVVAYDNDEEAVLERARLLWLRREAGELWEPPVEVKPKAGQGNKK